ncbi:2Fe-2S iron-sulfur cluster-binding protein [Thiohalobacter thiocyanaticus]|uniref:Ferredoxin n=1 Tax=Thiohalobacter thiocyanaticus TaxID=585455 RepID=A0A426QJS4_9GAMM|nr:2Fe-2S iron-sulfur cluster-binding protein [Thiohalobacter thiocyanaticus]RRQ22022.1 hypothetical protein D6C00_08720 [Thiohalobacter thiocyanaticus]
MAQLISLSRAARLVGVKRATLQKQIRAGELHTFEGELDLSELLKVYPKTDLDASGMVERADRIIENAFGKVLDTKDLPDAEVLATRVTLLSHELGTARARVNRFNKLVNRISDKLDTLERAVDSPAVQEFRQWLESEIDEVQTARGLHEEVLATDTFMRLLAAHVQLKPSGHDFFLNGSETLLHAGLRSGMQLRYGCTDGSCGRCRARLISGEAKRVRAWAECLSEDELSEGYVTMCTHTAMTDVLLKVDEVTKPEEIESQTLPATLRRVDDLGQGMVGLMVNPAEPHRLQFLSGQSALLRIDEAEASYPIASCPCDETQIEFHINTADDNPLAARVAAGLDDVKTLEMEGPRGGFVLNLESVHSLVFIAWDREFASIKSLIEQALALDVAEQIYIYWVTTDGSKPYLHNLCRAWQDAIDNVNYVRLEADPSVYGEGARDGVADTLAGLAEQHYNVKVFDFYIGGPQAVAEASRRYLIARGVPPAQVRTRHD